MHDTFRFRNLDGSGPTSFRRVFRWMVLDRLAGRRRRAPARTPVPEVEPDLELLRRPPLDGLRLTWLGHASWLVQGEGSSILVDPALGPRISGVIPRNAGPGLAVEQLPRIDACLVTHNHYDHLDLPTLRAVAAPVVAGLGTRPSLKGLPCTELAWWDRLHVCGLSVTFVPSQHWSRRGLADVNEALWGGFVIEGGGVRVYHAGDTAYFGGFREIGQRFPPFDAALLPIGAYDPEWFMRPQHMNPEDAVQAFVDLGARRLVAMHWGTFKLTDEPLDEPPRRLRAEWKRRGLPPDALSILPIGASLPVPAAGTAPSTSAGPSSQAAT
ncbi:MAG TPA: MBL fold metallo-hydrolase [Myxococcaceae bacterium]|nr:MBL fold metallo-hydrolase [Myxococcaceae bacterium]